MELQSGVVLRCRAWLGALVVLGVNDHVLKGSGVLSSAITGKLSDFAGLFVAPALLALVLRTRGRVQLLACHVAVAAVFASIQLSPAFAVFWSGVMGSVGFPWVITADPTDLVALPVVAVSYRYFAATLDAPQAPPIPPLVRRAVLATSLVLCMATSDPEGWGTYRSGVHLHNASGETLVVQLRGLRPSVLVDCPAIEDDPGRLLPDSAFDRATRYELPPRHNLPIGAHTHGGDCSAVLVSGTGLRPTMIFFDHGVDFGAPPQRYRSDDDLQPGAVVIEFDGDGEHSGYSTPANDRTLLFEHSPATGELAPECRPVDPSQRLAWSSGLSGGYAIIHGIERGPDGCFALELQRTGAFPFDADADLDAGTEADQDADAGMDVPADAPDQRLDPAAATVTEYVCPGVAQLPFAVGERVEIDTTAGLAIRSARSTLRVAGAAGLWRDETGASAPGTFSFWLDGSRAGSAVLRARPRCGLFVQEDCARVGRAGYLQIETGDAAAIVEPGAGPIAVGDSVIAVVPLAEQVVLIDTQCSAQGRDRLGADFDLGLVTQGAGR